jgi:hypothetical protein
MRHGARIAPGGAPRWAAFRRGWGSAGVPPEDHGVRGGGLAVEVESAITQRRRPARTGSGALTDQVLAGPNPAGWASCAPALPATSPPVERIARTAEWAGPPVDARSLPAWGYDRRLTAWAPVSAISRRRHHRRRVPAGCPAEVLLRCHGDAQGGGLTRCREGRSVGARCECCRGERSSPRCVHGGSLGCTSALFVLGDLPSETDGTTAVSRWSRCSQAVAGAGHVGSWEARNGPRAST